MTTPRQIHAKGFVDGIENRRVLLTTYTFGNRELIELRARIMKRGRGEVDQFIDLNVKQARELRRQLDLAIAAAEAAARHDGTNSDHAADRGVAEDARHDGSDAAA
jgi:hypothetical protein